MQVVILCGGLGTRLAEETEVRPKPMVEVGGKPLLWHIMKIYSHHGFHDFILCLGYKGDVIRDYFLNYHARNSDVRVQLDSERVEHLGAFHDEKRWSVLLAETGDVTPTGGRIKRIAKYIEGETFLATYGDGVGDVDLGRLVEFHRAQGRAATVTAIRPQTRFGELRVDGELATSFREKPQLDQGWVNGGFFAFERRALDSLTDESTLEREPLERLAKDGQLAVFRHEGYWRSMDTLRDKRALEDEWSGGKPGWKVW